MLYVTKIKFASREEAMKYNSDILKSRIEAKSFGCIIALACEHCFTVISDSMCLCAGSFICPVCGGSNGDGKTVSEHGTKLEYNGDGIVGYQPTGIAILDNNDKGFVNRHDQFYKDQAESWRKLFEEQRGGEAFNAIQQELVEARAEIDRLKGVIRDKEQGYV